MDGAFPPFEPDGNQGDGRGPRLREIPFRMLVPNLITLLAICAGVTGIRLAFEGRFKTAVTLVLIAAFLDGIDGRAARALKATSKFGAQMDSLADIVNFGVAPAIVLYAWVLDQAGTIGWIAALLYIIACGLRLARFNVLLENAARPAWQTDFFVGVPAPAGALLLLLPAYLGFLGAPRNETVGWLAAAYTVAIAFLLVSRLPVYSGKGAGSFVRRDAVMPLFLVIVAYVALLVSFPWHTLAATAVAYAAALPWGMRLYARRARENANGERASDSGDQAASE